MWLALLNIHSMLSCYGNVSSDFPGSANSRLFNIRFRDDALVVASMQRQS